eukprot:TRINITY_DN1312_c0_g1_i1.p1 TRINITY_DN1312_c0_g1~~TRINITY_DN1312_c0_g1_i1.p1  ORF type:complete len:190 (-),score=85.56 TRINITY_DN1312_c0_g1_i1:79-648(-)
MKSAMFVAAMCLAATFGSSEAVMSRMAVRVAAKQALKASSEARVNAISSAIFAVESAINTPKNVSKAQEDKVVKVLEDQVEAMKKNVAALKTMDKKEKSDDEKKKAASLENSMKPADKAMMAKMNQWSERMNRKTRLGAMDVISKLENAIHFVKKGALNGKDPEAAKQLNNVLSKMGAMMGGSTGNFLH